MPYRPFSLFLILSGSVFVLALILLGRDLHEAIRTGPTWKRKLVTAGLVLLATLGITSGCSTISGPTSVVGLPGIGFDDRSLSERELTETKQWKHVTKAWKAAVPFAESGESSSRQRKSVERKLDLAKQSIDELVEAGLLMDAESQLLVTEADTLWRKIVRNRPTGLTLDSFLTSTCYSMQNLQSFSPTYRSANRLTERLPQLEKLAESETVHPQVLAKTLTTIEEDLEVLDGEELTDGLTDDSNSKANELSREVRAHVAKIKGKLNGLPGNRRWRVVVGAWREAAPLAESGKSTTLQREAVEQKLELAKRNAGELAEAGLLTAAEAQLLVTEADRLWQEIVRYPPSDSNVMCYNILYSPPAQESLERLNQRLPLLKQSTSEGTVHPVALRKVLGSIEADIQTLSDDDELERLKKEQRDRAETQRAQAEATVAEIKSILEASE